ncbi:hypothetical protein [Candidatus Williamhamiltonella defendens]|uniref:hypothetical protein n=1 Tax=Candidatus Williamhamiltonella defendens TaxID=138072 RepID=UPI0018750D4C|nr:hypothetical protein [Candidatus Hamiltonella defensa]
MTTSVAATELAKRGKCEAMIKKSANYPRPTPEKHSKSATSRQTFSAKRSDQTLETLPIHTFWSGKAFLSCRGNFHM